MIYPYDPTISIQELSLRIKGEAYMECLIVLVVALIIYLVVKKLRRTK